MQVSAPLRSAGGPSVRVPKVLTQCAHSVTRCCTAETKWSSSHDCFAALISPARLPANLPALACYEGSWAQWLAGTPLYVEGEEMT